MQNGGAHESEGKSPESLTEPSEDYPAGSAAMPRLTRRITLVYRFTAVTLLGDRPQAQRRGDLGCNLCCWRSRFGRVRQSPHGLARWRSPCRSRWPSEPDGKKAGPRA